MGSTRSFAQLAKDTGYAVHVLAQIAKAENWIEQCRKIDTRVAEQFVEEAVATVAEIERRHLAVAALLIGRGLEFLERNPISTTRDALKALEIGVKMNQDTLKLNNTETTPEQKVAELVVATLKKVEAKEASKPFTFDPNFQPPPEPKLIEAAGTAVESSDVSTERRLQDRPVDSYPPA